MLQRINRDMADDSDSNPEESASSVQEAPDAHDELQAIGQQQQQLYGGDSFEPDSPDQPASPTADDEEEVAYPPAEPAADYDQPPPASPGHSDDGNDEDYDNDAAADHPASPDNPVEDENPVQPGNYEENADEDHPASSACNDEENNPASPPASPRYDGAENTEDPTATSHRGYSDEAEPTTLSDDAGRREEEEGDTAAVAVAATAEEEQDADDDDMQISDTEDSALVPTAAAEADVVESVVEVSEPMTEVAETDVVVEQQVEVQEEVVAAEEVPAEKEVPAEEEFQSSSRKRRRLSSSTPADDAEGGGEEARRAVAGMAVADDSDAESDFEGFEPPEAKQPRRRQLLDDDDDDDIEGQSQSQSEQQQQAGSGGIIADIFGESDQEDEGADVGEVSGKAGEEEFEGFNAAEAEAAAGGGGGGRGSDDDDSSSSSSSGDEGGAKNDDEEEGQAPGFPVSDFDAIMAQKKNERRQSRKRSSARGGELLTDADSVITQVVYEMLEAAQSDKELMKSGRPATKKMKMLPKVVSLLTKADVLANLSESAMLSAITEWLAPCPDGSLPSLQIRDTLLRMLETIPGIDADGLATSGLGKAVMYLYKHRRETRANKAVCGRLINAWSRPIFELTTNYSTLTKEEREERDYANIPQHRRSSAGEQRPAIGRSDSTGGSGGGPSGSGSKLKLGDPGYVPRARVPMPSNKDYVVRPKPKIDVDVKMASAPPKKKERQVWFERHVRQLSDKKRSSKVNKKAMPISIEGRKMAL